MDIHDEDDDQPDMFQRSRRRREEEQEDEEDFGAPDDLGTVQCSSCGKHILEDSPQCPYCKQWQAEEGSTRKPVWFVLTAIVCIGMLGGFALLWLLLGGIPWLKR